MSEPKWIQIFNKPFPTGLHSLHLFFYQMDSADNRSYHFTWVISQTLKYSLNDIFLFCDTLCSSLLQQRISCFSVYLLRISVVSPFERTLYLLPIMADIAECGYRDIFYTATTTFLPLGGFSSCSSSAQPRCHSLDSVITRDTKALLLIPVFANKQPI